MANVLFRMLVALLAVIGIVELLRAVVFRLLRTDNSGDFYLVLTFSGHDERAEESLRSALERARWCRGFVQVVCLDGGMDAETRRICGIACSEYPGAFLFTPAEFRQYLMQRFAKP